MYYKVMLKVDRYWYENLDVHKPRKGIRFLSIELIPHTGYFVGSEGTEAGLRALACELFDDPKHANKVIVRTMLDTLDQQAQHGNQKERERAIRILDKMSETIDEACEVLMRVNADENARIARKYRSEVTE